MKSIVGANLAGYIARVQQIPLLTLLEERALAERIDAGRTAEAKSGRLNAASAKTVLDGRRAEEELVQRNLRLAVWIAEISSGRRSSDSEFDLMFRPTRTAQRLIAELSEFADDRMELEDRIQEAQKALVLAASEFCRPGHKCFASVASLRIARILEEAILQERFEYRFKPAQAQRAQFILATARRLRDELGRTPTAEEISGELEGTEHSASAEIVLEQLEEIARMPRWSLEQMGSMALNLFDDADESGDPARAAEEQELERLVIKLLDTLSEREAGIVERRFGLRVVAQDDGTKAVAAAEPMTCDDAGKAFGVSKERIRQIEGKTLSKLRHPTRADAVRVFVGGEDGSGRRSATSNLHDRATRVVVTVASRPDLYDLAGCEWLEGLYEKLTGLKAPRRARG